MNAVNFLIDTVFDLYLMVVLLRVWLQLARADFYNPFSQFIVKATQPVVAPLRRIIPPIGGLDTATVLFAFVVAVAKILVLSAVLNYGINLPIVLASGLFILVTAIFKLLFWVLVIRAILSWVSQGQHPVEAVMIQLTEPLLRPIRRIIPPLGGFDLSMLVVLLGLQFVEKLVTDLLAQILG
ncbi:YggT family protein [Psychromonas sp. B3M02]|uniref:YggT family protein n=1 Tax=unclassified Psychromonas TaxID=2614957 RepID=UPI000DE8CF35|nr:YggT family protein [Psychromonas sp. B3M02]RBW45630.1 YggT family protein [Psychromonas sp. B3M02]